MRPACLLLLLAVALAAADAAAAAPDGWSVRITPYDRIYPALELSQARRRDGAGSQAFGAGSGLVAVHVRALHDREHVTLTVQAPGLRAAADVAAVLPQRGRDYVLRPPLAWDLRRLLASDVARPEPLSFELRRDGAAAGTRTVTASLRPLSEALYFVRDGASTVDLSWIFAAYVDENDPVVDRILADASASGIVAGFGGYGGGDDAVYRQVWAVWQAIAAHGLRYSAADPGVERGPRVFSQRVRLLESTWNDRSANCIDGSVLIASALQRIGLRSTIALVPGHAFVGFHLDRDGTRSAWLETTVLGAPPPLLPRLPRYAADLDPGQARRLGIAAFAGALARGSQRFARAAARFDRAHRPDYALIDIDQARAFGIGPIEESARGRDVRGAGEVRDRPKD